MPVLTPHVPDGLIDLMKALTKNILKEKPENIYQFAVVHFEKLIIERDGSLEKGYERFQSEIAFLKAREKLEKSLSKAQRVRNSEKSNGNAEIDSTDCSTEKDLQATPSNQRKFKTRKLSSRKPSETLISIKEEDGEEAAKREIDEEMQRRNRAAFKIQGAFRRFQGKIQELGKECKPKMTEQVAALIIQKTLKTLFMHKMTAKGSAIESVKNESVEICASKDVNLEGIQADEENTGDFSELPVDKKTKLCDQLRQNSDDQHPSLAFGERCNENTGNTENSEFSAIQQDHEPKPDVISQKSSSTLAEILLEPTAEASENKFVKKEGITSNQEKEETALVLNVSDPVKSENEKALNETELQNNSSVDVTRLGSTKEVDVPASAENNIIESGHVTKEETDRNSDNETKISDSEVQILQDNSVPVNVDIEEAKHITKESSIESNEISSKPTTEHTETILAVVEGESLAKLLKNEKNGKSKKESHDDEISGHDTQTPCQSSTEGSELVIDSTIPNYDTAKGTENSNKLEYVANTEPADDKLELHSGKVLDEHENDDVNTPNEEKIQNETTSNENEEKDLKNNDIPIEQESLIEILHNEKVQKNEIPGRTDGEKQTGLLLSTENIAKPTDINSTASDKENFLEDIPTDTGHTEKGFEAEVKKIATTTNLTTDNKMVVSDEPIKDVNQQDVHSSVDVDELIGETEKANSTLESSNCLESKNLPVSQKMDDAHDTSLVSDDDNSENQQVNKDTEENKQKLATGQLNSFGNSSIEKDSLSILLKDEKRGSRPQETIGRDDILNAESSFTDSAKLVAQQFSDVKDADDGITEHDEDAEPEPISLLSKLIQESKNDDEHRTSEEADDKDFLNTKRDADMKIQIKEDLGSGEDGLHNEKTFQRVEGEQKEMAVDISKSKVDTENIMESQKEDIPQSYGSDIKPEVNISGNLTDPSIDQINITETKFQDVSNHTEIIQSSVIDTNKTDALDTNKNILDEEGDIVKAVPTEEFEGVDGNVKADANIPEDVNKNLVLNDNNLSDKSAKLPQTETIKDVSNADWKEVLPSKENTVEVADQEEIMVSRSSEKDTLNAEGQIKNNFEEVINKADKDLVPKHQINPDSIDDVESVPRLDIQTEKSDQFKIKTNSKEETNTENKTGGYDQESLVECLLDFKNKPLADCEDLDSRTDQLATHSSNDKPEQHENLDITSETKNDKNQDVDKETKIEDVASKSFDQNIQANLGPKKLSCTSLQEKIIIDSKDKNSENVHEPSLPDEVTDNPVNMTPSPDNASINIVADSNQLGDSISESSVLVYALGDSKQNEDGNPALLPDTKESNSNEDKVNNSCTGKAYELQKNAFDTVELNPVENSSGIKLIGNQLVDDRNDKNVSSKNCDEVNSASSYVPDLIMCDTNNKGKASENKDDVVEVTSQLGSNMMLRDGGYSKKENQNDVLIENMIKDNKTSDNSLHGSTSAEIQNQMKIQKDAVSTVLSRAAESEDHLNNSSNTKTDFNTTVPTQNVQVYKGSEDIEANQKEDTQKSVESENLKGLKDLEANVVKINEKVVSSEEINLPRDSDTDKSSAEDATKTGDQNFSNGNCRNQSGSNVFGSKRPDSQFSNMISELEPTKKLEIEKQQYDSSEDKGTKMSKDINQDEFEAENIKSKNCNPEADLILEKQESKFLQTKPTELNVPTNSDDEITLGKLSDVVEDSLAYDLPEIKSNSPIRNRPDGQEVQLTKMDVGNLNKTPIEFEQVIPSIYSSAQEQKTVSKESPEISNDKDESKTSLKEVSPAVSVENKHDQIVDSEHSSKGLTNSVESNKTREEKDRKNLDLSNAEHFEEQAKTGTEKYPTGEKELNSRQTSNEKLKSTSHQNSMEIELIPHLNESGVNSSHAAKSANEIIPCPLEGVGSAPGDASKLLTHEKADNKKKAVEYSSVDTIQNSDDVGQIQTQKEVAFTIDESPHIATSTEENFANILNSNIESSDQHLLKDREQENQKEEGVDSQTNETLSVSIPIEKSTLVEGVKSTDNLTGSKVFDENKKDDHNDEDARADILPDVNKTESFEKYHPVPMRMDKSSLHSELDSQDLGNIVGRPTNEVIDAIDQSSLKNVRNSDQQSSLNRTKREAPDFPSKEFILEELNDQTHMNLKSQQEDITNNRNDDNSPEILKDSNNNIETIIFDTEIGSQLVPHLSTDNSSQSAASLPEDQPLANHLKEAIKSLKDDVKKLPKENSAEDSGNEEDGGVQTHSEGKTAKHNVSEPLADEQESISAVQNKNKCNIVDEQLTEDHNPDTFCDEENLSDQSASKSDVNILDNTKNKKEKTSKASKNKSPETTLAPNNEKSDDTNKTEKKNSEDSASQGFQSNSSEEQVERGKYTRHGNSSEEQVERGKYTRHGDVESQPKERNPSSVLSNESQPKERNPTRVLSNDDLLEKCTGIVSTDHGLDTKQEGESNEAGNVTNLNVNNLKVGVVEPAFDQKAMSPKEKSEKELENAHHNINRMQDPSANVIGNSDSIENGKHEGPYHESNEKDISKKSLNLTSDKSEGVAHITSESDNKPMGKLEQGPQKYISEVQNSKELALQHPKTLDDVNTGGEKVNFDIQDPTKETIEKSMSEKYKNDEFINEVPLEEAATETDLNESNSSIPTDPNDERYNKWMILQSIERTDGQTKQKGNNDNDKKEQKLLADESLMEPNHLKILAPKIPLANILKEKSVSLKSEPEQLQQIRDDPHSPQASSDKGESQSQNSFVHEKTFMETFLMLERAANLFRLGESSSKIQHSENLGQGRTPEDKDSESVEKVPGPLQISTFKIGELEVLPVSAELGQEEKQFLVADSLKKVGSLHETNRNTDVSENSKSDINQRGDTHDGKNTPVELNILDSAAKVIQNAFRNYVNRQDGSTRVEDNDKIENVQASKDERKASLAIVEPNNKLDLDLESKGLWYVGDVPIIPSTNSSGSEPSTDAHSSPTPDTGETVDPRIVQNDDQYLENEFPKDNKLKRSISSLKIMAENVIQGSPETSTIELNEDESQNVPESSKNKSSDANNKIRDEENHFDAEFQEQGTVADLNLKSPENSSGNVPLTETNLSKEMKEIDGNKNVKGNTKVNSEFNVTEPRDLPENINKEKNHNIQQSSEIGTLQNSIAENNAGNDILESTENETPDATKKIDQETEQEPPFDDGLPPTDKTQVSDNVELQPAIDNLLQANNNTRQVSTQESPRSDVENMDISAFGEDSLEAMYYSLKKHEILLDKMHLQASVCKSASTERVKPHNITVEDSEVKPEEETDKPAPPYSENKEQRLDKDTYNVADKNEVGPELAIQEAFTSEPKTSLNEESESEEQERTDDLTIEIIPPAERKLSRNDSYYSACLTRPITSASISPRSKADQDSENPLELSKKKTEHFIQQLHGSSSCMEDSLDEITSDEIRRNMLAYSISEADSDYCEPGERTNAVFNDFNISTAFETTPSTDTDSTIISAVTKIQAGARGFLTRRRLRRASVATTSFAERKSSFGNDAIGESLEDLIEEQDAARRIQKSFRRYRNRKTRQSAPSLRNNIDSGDSSKSWNNSSEEPAMSIIDVKLEQKPKMASKIPKIKSTDKVVSSSSSEGKMEVDDEVLKKDETEKQPSSSKLGTMDSKSSEQDHSETEMSPEDFNLAARRMTLQRGDAVQRNSTGEDESNSPSGNGNADEVDDNNQSPRKPQPRAKSSGTERSKVHTDRQMKKDRAKRFGTRQKTMPVQIDFEILRVLPKHLRKRIRSADETNKQKTDF